MRMMRIMAGLLLAASAYGQGPVTERKLSSFGKVTTLGQTDLVAVSVAPGTVSEQLRGITISNLNRLLSNSAVQISTNGFVGREITNGFVGPEIIIGFATLAGATNVLRGMMGGHLDTDGNALMAGWGIFTEWSQYEGPRQGKNMHSLVIRSMGSSLNSTNGGGDGYLQLVSNLASSNSMWISYKGDLYAASSTNFFNRRTIIENGVTGGSPFVRLGGNSNLWASLLLRNSGLNLGVGPPKFIVVGLSSNVTVNASNVIVGGTLFSSTTAMVNSDTSEDTLLTATVPAGALTNSQDTVEFMITGRLANDPATKRVRVYYGSSLIGDTLSLTPSNCTFRITGTITANADQVSQYVEASLSWKSPNIHTQTNWSLTIAETNGLDTVLGVTGLASAANVITNECLKVRIQPAGPYTQ